jgi:anti-anti-sigma factor
MIVLCDNCQKKYRLDDKKIPAKGTRVKCSNCNHIFKVPPIKKQSQSQPKNDPAPETKNPPSNAETADSNRKETEDSTVLGPVKTEVDNLPNFAEWDNDIIIVIMPGDTLDASNCQEFKDAIFCILETPNKVIFNMENIQFVDSSGCGTLNSSIKRIKKKGGDIKICNVMDQVGAIFRLIKLDRVFHICDTLEEAMRAYDSL